MFKVNPSKLQQIEKKMASILASDKTLKESAQRAFQAVFQIRASRIRIRNNLDGSGSFHQSINKQKKNKNLDFSCFLTY
jgi:hypothetical protein